MWKLLFFLAAIPILILVNFYFRYKTYKSMGKALKKKRWKKLTKEEYAKRCYHFIADRYTKMNRCWLKYPLRNMYLRNIWKFKGESIPCLIENALFQRCLLKRFEKSEVKTVLCRHFRQGIYIHFYSRVKLRGRWVDVDVWGKKWGIPFGGNIYHLK
ncbi:MAG: hypothetical protein ISS95_01540 [Candidatus Aenigmarchaeota archaeon]|nr:hypothetical protein [Candidatus Aenigmarchaeota archaeon]